MCEGKDKADEGEDKAAENEEEEEKEDVTKEVTPEGEDKALPLEDEGEESEKEEGVEKEEKPEEEAEEVVILRRVDADFERWLGGLSEEKLEQVVSRLMRAMRMRRRPGRALSV